MSRLSATGRLLALLGLWAALGLAAGAGGAGLAVWAAAGAALAALAGYEAAALARAPLPEVERRVPRSLALGSPNQVTLALHNPGARTTTVEVFDHHPSSCASEGLPWTVSLPAGGRLDLTYRVRPLRRGQVVFAQTALRVRGPLGLLIRHARVGRPRTLRVYPNFHQVVRFVLLLLANRVGQMGIRKVRRRGEGLEFEQLRDYRAGDLLRQVDWKATARRRSLISREYRDEKDQRVVFLLDCGRRMRARDGELSHFDHVLNAILLVSHVAARQGDSIGLLTFGGAPRFVAPTKGAAAVPRVLEQTYDLEPSTAPSDYAEAARQLLTRVRRRALVVLVTNLRDEDHAELEPALATLRTRNVVLLASLREAALDEASEAEVRDLSSALRVAEAHRHLRERRLAQQRLRTGGAIVLDVVPADLPVGLVNQYLEVKRSGRL